MPRGSRVLVGLSGGSDSVALTCLLLDLAEYEGFAVIGLAHLNHGLRASATRDSTFCRRLAEQYGRPFAVEDANVEDYAQLHSLSIEDAARRIRYAFLERVADDMEADRVAVGHTQDDQAETFLLKLIRGAGLTGLGGIYPRRGRVVRPLLETTHADLRAYLRSRGQSWVDDETNNDLANPRNRVRHCVLPELDRAAGASVHPAIARATAVMREDGQWLDELGRQQFERAAIETAAGLELDLAMLAETPAPVMRRVLLQAMRCAAGGREIGWEHVEAVRGLLNGDRRGVDVPGTRVELRGRKLVLCSRETG